MPRPVWKWQQITPTVGYNRTFGASKMRDVVQIQRDVESKSASYSRITRWETVADVRAWVEPLTGHQSFDNERLGHAASYKVHIRYRTDIDTTMRILWHARILKVVYVWPASPPFRELEILCDEDLT